MKKVYISRNYKTVNSAGGKAKTDMEKILQEIGFVNIGLKQSFNENKVVDFLSNLIGMLKAALSMPSQGILFLQYPTKKYYSFICKVAHLRKTKVVTLVHDLGSFRRKRLTATKEIARLSNSDYVIALNSNMADWLKENGYAGGVGTLDIWDFLSATINTSSISLGNKKNYIVNYMGALNHRKNSFLYKLSEQIYSYDFYLYGSGFEDKYSDQTNSHFVYKGFIPSEELIATIQGDFGLVWDGDSIDTCSGSFGSYLHYNNPHKASLYIRCHLPLIVWSNAGMASFVEDNGIGFSVSSLSEVNDKLSALSENEYIEMKKRVVNMSRMLNDGYYLKKALINAEEYLTVKSFD